MCRIVFWNTNRKDLTEAVCALALASDVDIIILNESAGSISETEKALKRTVSPSFYVPFSLATDRFHCFCKNIKFDLSEMNKGFRTSFRKLALGSNKLLLGLIHGLDMRNHDKETRQGFAHDLANEIAFVKSEAGHNRVILSR